MDAIPTQGVPNLPPAYLSLRQNFIGTFVGNVVYAGSSWAMLVVLAKLGTPETVGQFALGLAVTAPVILFANLQLRSIQATDARNEYLFRDYFGLRLVMLALALLVIAGIVCLSSYPLELALTVVVIGFGKAVDAISDVVYGLLQRHEQMDRISISLILKGILSLIMLALGQYLTRSVLWASVGWALASVIVVVFYDLRSAALILRRTPHAYDSRIPRFNFLVLRKLTRLALPLGITMVLLSLGSSIPRYFVEHYSGERGLGIFAAMAYLMTAGSTVIGALGQAATPRLAKQYAAGRRPDFQGLLLKLTGIGALLGGAGVVVAVAAGRPILTLLYQPEYATRNDVFIWLMVAAGISYVASLGGYAITAARYFEIQPIIFAVCTAATLLLCAWLIPPYGILGAAWATLGASLIQCILVFSYTVYALNKSTGERIGV
ncbi:MAG TPA: oligosaccharide flippase family protein [Aggregatilineales bacterium]|nr:oligosaccharide flippase family protein [Aggregatilineales bacterium]